MKIIVFALLLSAHCELTTALKRQHLHFSNATTWTKAQRHCRSSYVDLSSVDSQEEITALNTLSASSISPAELSNSYRGYSWVGLRLNSTSNWQWSDGGNSSFIIWAAGQPVAQSNYVCCSFKNGEVYNYDCTYQYNYYFCYKWDTELIVVKENKSWEDALQYCRTHHTDLASLPTNLHLIQATQATAETSSVWTGLRFMSGSWTWLSGEDLGNPSAQLQACPANYTYCGSLNLKNLNWENRNCMEELNFVCY